jgi:hypothetical protein
MSQKSPRRWPVVANSGTVRILPALQGDRAAGGATTGPNPADCTEAGESGTLRVDPRAASDVSLPAVSPNARAAIWLTPPSVRASEASSMGTMKTFWVNLLRTGADAGEK